MGCNLLQGLCTLFSNTSKPVFEKATRQPFVKALDSVKKMLEQSCEPEWQDLATRLQTASKGSSGSHNELIFPIDDNSIYLRKSTLEELYPVCIDLLKSHMDQDQREIVWDLLVESSKVLYGDQQNHKQGLEQNTASQNHRQLAY